MTFHIITLFPEVFDAYFKESIIGKAISKRRIKVKFYDLRKFSNDKKRKKADDKVYGGGPGMVLEPGPVVRAVEKAIGDKRQWTSDKRQGTGNKGQETRDKGQVKIILFAPAGRQFDNKIAQDLTKYKDVVLIAGRYEGVDKRIKKIFKVEEVSIGPYVLTGGEIPAMAVVDAVARQIKGVLGKDESLEEERYGVGVPAYTRPEIFKHKGKNYRVPKVLLSGNHKEIAAWRKAHRRASPSNDKKEQ